MRSGNKIAPRFFAHHETSALLLKKLKPAADVFLEKGHAVARQDPGGQFVGASLAHANYDVSKVWFNVLPVVNGGPGWLVGVGMKRPNDLQSLVPGGFGALVYLVFIDAVAIAIRVGSGGVINEHQVYDLFVWTAVTAQQQSTTFLWIQGLAMSGNGAAVFSP
jgi:hypothetical protein